MEHTENNSHISRVAMKAMGVFGGVQVVSILCSVVRTKLVALWIGTVGVGLFGLFNNALELLNIATNLGVRNSSVRDVSAAMSAGDTTLVGRLVAVVRRWSLWLGLAGAMLTISFAPLLSLYTFGNDEHIWGFVALSIAVLLMALTNGEHAVLQGTGALRWLASASLWGTLGGLAVSVPLFYWLREQSVLPSIVAYAACNALAAYLLRNRNYRNTPRPSNSDTFALGRNFIRLGIFMTIGNFAALLSTYIFNAWLNTHAGTAEVGLYNAGYTLVNKYTGLVFTALAMEYYPRLARVADNANDLANYVGQEVRVVMTVLAPVVTWFIVLRSTAVWLLYTSDFQPIVGFVAWGMVGTVFRGLSWSLAFVILAKGHGRIYMITEGISAATGLALNIAAYSLWGLWGLGVAFLTWYVIYTIVVAYVYVVVYKLRLPAGCMTMVAWTVGVAVATLAAMETGALWIAVAVAVLSTAIALTQLRTLWRQ